MNQTYELCHHGVKGMHWGIRRTPAQLGHLSEKLKKRNAKYSKRVPKLESKANLETSRGRALFAKGMQTRRGTDLSIGLGHMRMDKAAKHFQRADRYTRKLENYKRKIEKNNKKISEIDEQIVFDGKEYVQRMIES